MDKRKALTVLVLVFVNLINYMDRSTVAGMINSIKNDPYFNIHKDKYIGLLQTAFVICYMIFAPIFGYGLSLSMNSFQIQSRINSSLHYHIYLV